MQVVGGGIEIPAGALLEPTEITLARTDQEPPASFAPTSALFRLTPEGLRFHEPAELWLDAEQPGSARPRLYSSSADGLGYERLRTRTDETFLEAWVWHFSVFFAGDTFASLYYLGPAPARVGSDCTAPDDVSGLTRNWVFRVDDIPEGFEITRLDKDPGGIWIAGSSCNEASNWPLRIEPDDDGSQLLFAAPFPGQSPELDGRFTLTLSPTSGAQAGQAGPIETVIAPCWRTSIITELPSVTVSRLDTCGCFDAVFSGESNCVDPVDGLVDCGPAWDWTTNGFNADCTLVNPGQQPEYIAQHIGRDLLLDAVGVAGEANNGSVPQGSCADIGYTGEGCRRRCAVLEQARTLCTQQPYIPDFAVGTTDAERRQTRQALCHPGMEVGCIPAETPDYVEVASRIESDDELRAAMQARAAELLDQPHNYCTGQVQGGADGATSTVHIPYATAIPPYAVPGADALWTCEADGGATEDPYGSNAEIDAALQPYGGTLLGMGTSDINGLACRLKRALLECVAPNLGEGGLCQTELDSTGTEYAPWPGYCFGLSLGRSQAPFCSEPRHADNAHCNGRAIDLNGPLDLDYANDGNIVGCLTTDGPACTNTFTIPRVDLPPGLVAVMEGCGLQWLGRSNQAEGGAFGCDPMHFEVP